MFLGDKEVEANEVSVRSRKEGELGAMALDAVVNKLVEEVVSKAN